MGAIKETEPGERRVALVPDAVGRMRSLGLDLLVESGAGSGAFFPDEAYARAGASVVSATELRERADVLLCVRPPSTPPRSGQVLVGLLGGAEAASVMRRYADLGVTAVSLDLLPRTLSRAQSMDALTSQASVAGYKAALVAAGAYGGYFPMLVTAAGTARPAEVLVLGAGVAGLQAIGTARRLGAVVTGYDVRPEAHAEIRSLGAGVLDLAEAAAVSGAAGTGGYARALATEETLAQQHALAERVPAYDVVIATARVPGRRPPLLVTAEAVDRMRPGSVIVDLAASPLGGNVAGVEPGQTAVTGHGVTLIGAGDLAATVPSAASTAYARNLTNLLGVLTRDGTVRIDLTDEVQAAVVVTHEGRIVNPAISSSVTTGGKR